MREGELQQLQSSSAKVKDELETKVEILVQKHTLAESRVKQLEESLAAMAEQVSSMEREHKVRTVTGCDCVQFAVVSIPGCGGGGCQRVRGSYL